MGAVAPISFARVQTIRSVAAAGVASAIKEAVIKRIVFVTRTSFLYRAQIPINL